MFNTFEKYFPYVVTLFLAFFSWDLSNPQSLLIFLDVWNTTYWNKIWPEFFTSKEYPVYFRILNNCRKPPSPQKSLYYHSCSQVLFPHLPWLPAPRCWFWSHPSRTGTAERSGRRAVTQHYRLQCNWFSSYLYSTVKKLAIKGKMRIMARVRAKVRTIRKICDFFLLPYFGLFFLLQSIEEGLDLLFRETY